MYVVVLLEYCVCNAIINKKHVSKLPNAITFLHRDFNLSESNYNKPFCSHIKLPLNLTSELFSIKCLVESFIQMRSSTKLVSFHTKIVLFVRANQKLKPGICRTIVLSLWHFGRFWGLMVSDNKWANSPNFRRYRRGHHKKTMRPS